MNIWLTIGVWVGLTVGNLVYTRIKDKDWQRFSDMTYYQFIAIATLYLMHRYWLPLLK